MANEVTTAQNKAALMEQVLIGGDLSKLTPEQRGNYYMSVCESVGINPLTKPFEYITLNGKLTLYAKRDATDQLRQVRGVSVTISSREKIDDIYIVTAKATDKSGRSDESTGAVNIAGLKGEALANAYMKAETKAKRRVTLSICGLGMLDETEVESIQDITPEAKSLFKNASLRNTWFASVVDSFTSAKTLKELKTAVAGHKSKFDEMVENGNEHDLLAVDELRKRYEQIQARLKEEAEIDQTNYLDDDFRRSVDAEEKQAVEVNTPSVVVATAPSPATVALKHFRDGKPKWEYWVSEAIDALNKCDDVGAWLTAHDNLLTALEIADKGLYEKVNAVAIERMG